MRAIVSLHVPLVFSGMVTEEDRDEDKHKEEEELEEEGDGGRKECLLTLTQNGNCKNVVDIHTYLPWGPKPEDTQVLKEHQHLLQNLIRVYKSYAQR